MAFATAPTSGGSNDDEPRTDTDGTGGENTTVTTDYTADGSTDTSEYAPTNDPRQQDPTGLAGGVPSSDGTDEGEMTSTTDTSEYAPQNDPRQQDPTGLAGGVPSSDGTDMGETIASANEFAENNSGLFTILTVGLGAIGVLYSVVKN